MLLHSFDIFIFRIILEEMTESPYTRVTNSFHANIMRIEGGMTNSKEQTKGRDGSFHESRKKICRTLDGLEDV
jgi:hypothetical protein